MTQPSLNRVLIVERQEDVMARTTRALEGDAYIVTGTLSDAVALDLAGSTDFDALLIGGGVSLSDRRHIAAEVRRRQPSIPVVHVQDPTSVLIQLRQAFKEQASASAEAEA
jgi:DNA-binding response OmpR family regulator